MTGPVWPDLLTVHVTAGDIDRGVPQTCATCPIALATQRALGVLVEVGVSVISVLSPDRTETLAEWGMPQSAKDFIGRFDNALPVQPFTFAAERVR